jgi:hypothetical protein
MPASARKGGSLHFHFALVIFSLFLTRAYGSNVLAPDWTRSVCGQTVTKLLQNGTSLSPAFFAETPTSISNSTNYVLTISGCKALCSQPSRKSWNTDAGVRLITWLLPILLMVANVPLPEVGPARFAAVAILLGNPVRFVWNIVLELEVWAASWNASRNIYQNDKEMAVCLGRAIVIHQRIGNDPCVVKKRVEVERLWEIRLGLSGTEHRRDGSSYDGTVEERQCCAKTSVEPVITEMGPFQQQHSHPSHSVVQMLLRRLDSDLADFRKTSIFQALLASLVYVFLTLASFWSKLSDGSPPSGGKIGPAILLAFLLVAVGLGNVVGDFQVSGSEKAFRRFFKDLNRSDETLLCRTIRYPHMPHRSLPELEKSKSSSEILPRARVMPGYINGLKTGSWRRRIARFTLSIIPLGIAFAASVAVLTTPPVYFNCRSKLVIGIFVLWILSFFLDWIVCRLSFQSEKHLFRVIVFKDFIIAATNLTFINLASAGWGNTCECWGGATGKVQINPEHVFNFNNDVRYPSIVGSCFLLQILTFSVVLLLNWREYRMMWRHGASENESHHSVDV